VGGDWSKIQAAVCEQNGKLGLFCDYPLVEAIQQHVVKSPVLPDEASRHKLEEKPSDDVVERYRDVIHLGYIEWEKHKSSLRSFSDLKAIFTAE